MKLNVRRLQSIESLVLETRLIGAGNEIDRIKGEVGKDQSGQTGDSDSTEQGQTRSDTDYFEQFDKILDEILSMDPDELLQKLKDGLFFEKKFGSQGMAEFIEVYLKYLESKIADLCKTLDNLIDTDPTADGIKAVNQRIFLHAARLDILERIYASLKDNNRSTGVSIPAYDAVMATKRKIAFAYAKLINKLAEKMREASSKFHAAQPGPEKDAAAEEAINLGDMTREATEEYPEEVKSAIDDAVEQNEQHIKSTVGDDKFNDIKQKLTVDKTVADIIHRIVRYQYTTWTSEADVNREGDLIMSSINGLRRGNDVKDDTIIYLENLVTGIRQNLIKAIRTKDFNAKNYKGIHYDFNTKLPLYEKTVLPVTGKQIADATKIMKFRKASQEFIDFMFGGYGRQQDAAGRAFMETAQWMHAVYAKTLNGSAKIIGKALNGREGEMKADAITRLFIPNTSVVDEPKPKPISEDSVTPGVSPQVPGSIGTMGPIEAPTPTKTGSGDNFQPVPANKKKKKKMILEFSDFIKKLK